MIFMEKKYVATKALLVNPDGKILIVRDAGDGDHANFQGDWDLPGGRMDAQETPHETLVREVWEEVGLTIDPKGARPFFVDRWGVGGDVVGNPVIGIFFVVPVGHTAIRLSKEHDRFLWIDPQEAIPEEAKNDDLVEILHAYKERL